MTIVSDPAALLTFSNHDISNSQKPKPHKLQPSPELDWQKTTLYILLYSAIASYLENESQSLVETSLKCPFIKDQTLIWEACN